MGETDGGLLALLADDAETWETQGVSLHAVRTRSKHTLCVLTDVCCLDHGHVVSSVADAADPLLGVRADQPGNVGLLGRAAPACDDARELSGEVDELCLEVVEAELERFAVNDEAAVELGPDKVELVTDVLGRPH